jgi:hypothetical protein
MRLLGCATGTPEGGGTSTEPGGSCPKAVAPVKTNTTNTLRMELYVILEENA